MAVVSAGWLMSCKHFDLPLFSPLLLKPLIVAHSSSNEVMRTHNLFFYFRLNVPVNNFSVMSGFLGLTSTVGSSCVLLKDTTQFKRRTSRF